MGDLGSRTGYEILELLSSSTEYGGARGQALVKGHRFRIRTGVITNNPHPPTSQPYAPPDLIADLCAVWCSGRGGVLVDRGCGKGLSQVGYGKGHACTSFVCEG